MASVEALAEFLDLRGPLVLFAQLLLDGLQLFPQVIFPLGFVDPLPHLGLNLGADFQDGKLLGERKVGLLQPLPDIERLQDALFVGKRKIQGGSDEIGQSSRLVDIHGHDRQLSGKVGGHFHDFLEDPFDPHHEGLQIGLFLLVLQGSDLGADKRLALGKFGEADAGDPLDQKAEAVVRHLHHFQDARPAADFEQIFRL